MAESKKPSTSAAAKSRSAAAKKGAETRKKRAAAKAAPQVDRQRSAPKSQPAKAKDVAVTQEPQKAEGLSDYRPAHKVLKNAGLDQHAAEKARQKELQAERDEHLRRTGDVSR